MQCEGVVETCIPNNNTSALSLAWMRGTSRRPEIPPGGVLSREPTSRDLAGMFCTPAASCACSGPGMLWFQCGQRIAFRAGAEETSGPLHSPSFHGTGLAARRPYLWNSITFSSLLMFLVEVLQVMEGMGSPEASQVKVIWSSNSIAVLFST